MLIPMFLIYFRHRRRDRWIKEEAEEWLANRSERRSAPTRTWPNKVRRGALLVPSIVALAVFLFLPESMGIVSHLFSGRTVELNNHRLHTPVTSFIRSYHNSYLNVLIGRGIGRVGLMPYWRQDPPFSSLFFYAILDPLNDHYSDEFLTREKVILERTMAFGDETLTCWQIIPKSGPVESDFIAVSCVTSKNDLTASFYGSRRDATVFYKILDDATESK